MKVYALIQNTYNNEKLSRYQSVRTFTTFKSALRALTESYEDEVRNFEGACEKHITLKEDSQQISGRAEAGILGVGREIAWRIDETELEGDIRTTPTFTLDLHIEEEVTFRMTDTLVERLEDEGIEATDDLIDKCIVALRNNSDVMFDYEKLDDFLIETAKKCANTEKEKNQ